MDRFITYVSFCLQKGFTTHAKLCMKITYHTIYFMIAGDFNGTLGCE